MDSTGLDGNVSLDWVAFDLLASAFGSDIQQPEHTFEDFFDFQAASEWPALAFTALDCTLEQEQCLKKDSSSHELLPLLQKHTPTVPLQPLGPFSSSLARHTQGDPLLQSTAKPQPRKRPHSSTDSTTTSNKKRTLETAKGQVLDGYFCFPLSSNGPTYQQRSRYSASRKAEVNEVREIGACLRCKLLKKPVRIASHR
jgi:hypothetical protein